jgi:hypothetical protein
MLRELDQRATDGLTVTLLWDDVLDTVVVQVDDHGRTAETTVAGESALDAFQHPFCYVTTTPPDAEPSTKVDEPADLPVTDDDHDALEGASA